MALAALVVLLLAIGTWAAMQQLVESNRDVRHTLEVINVLQRAEAQLYRAESAHRELLTTNAPVALRERENAAAQMLSEMDRALTMTQDNPLQQRQGASLRQLLQQRLQAYHGTDGNLAEGPTFRAGAAPRFAAMIEEEQRLLELREDSATRRLYWLRASLSAAVLAVLALLPLVFLRLRSQLAARDAAVLAARHARRNDAIHARAMTLFNARSDRRAAVEGTLELLAEYPEVLASAFYVHDEWAGALRLQAGHAAPQSVAAVVPLREGPLGEAARTQRTVRLQPGDALDWPLEAGLARGRPAELLLCPAVFQGKLLGLLVAAAGTVMPDSDVASIERLCHQLGVALSSLAQLESQELLATQLRETADEVQRTNEELQRANRLKSEFLANMSHELRTPLNAVIGFSELLRDGLAGPLNDEQREYVGDIHGSGSHLLSLINDILDLSKIEAGQMDLQLQAVLPSQLAESALSVVRESAVERGIRLEDAVPPQLPALLLDLRRAKQILYNLVSNAVKFTRAGGQVTVTMARVPRSQWQQLAEGPGARMFRPRDAGFEHWLQVQVRDTGIGIAPDGLAALFQPFVQIDSSLTRRFEGTGLGLTMVQRLADLHGGGVGVSSVPEEGTTFTVWLPWREPADDDKTVRSSPAGNGAPAAPPAAVAPAAGGADQPAPLLLVVEDDERSATVLRAQLQNNGYRVEVAADARSGLQLAIALQPAAIVLDVVLPGVDGWDLLSQLKDEPATRHIPVVIVSVTDTPERGFALGATQVLVKPVSQEDLLAALTSSGLQPEAGGEVLVVDDDPHAVRLVSKHLQAAGFTVRAAYGGQQALDIAHQHPPDLIVLDLMMPHVSGFDVVEALSRRPETAQVPIVVLSSRHLTAADRGLLQGPVQRILEKSQFQPAVLLAEVRRALAHAATQRPAAQGAPR